MDAFKSALLAASARIESATSSAASALSFARADAAIARSVSDASSARCTELESRLAASSRDAISHRSALIEESERARSSEAAALAALGVARTQLEDLRAATLVVPPPVPPHASSFADPSVTACVTALLIATEKRLASLAVLSTRMETQLSLLKNDTATSVREDAAARAAASASVAALGDLSAALAEMQARGAGVEGSRLDGAAAAAAVAAREAAREAATGEASMRARVAALSAALDRSEAALAARTGMLAAAQKALTLQETSLSKLRSAAARARTGEATADAERREALQALEDVDTRAAKAAQVSDGALAEARADAEAARAATAVAVARADAAALEAAAALAARLAATPPPSLKSPAPIDVSMLTQCTYCAGSSGGADTSALKFLVSALVESCAGTPGAAEDLSTTTPVGAGGKRPRYDADTATRADTDSEMTGEGV